MAIVISTLPAPPTIAEVVNPAHATLYLDPASWDLALDTSGNMALAPDPYCLAQDAASAIKTFKGEVYYDTNLGIPYFAQILGKYPSIQYMKQQFVAAALTVPDVIAAKAFISGSTDRVVSGQVQITNNAGIVAAAEF